MSRVVRVTDFAAPELDIYARTTENQLVCREDPENGKFIAETPMVIERALDAGYVPVSFLMEEKYLENQGKAFMERCPDVPVYTAELSVLQNLIGYPLTRGMLCAMRRRPAPELSALCKASRRVAVLENVMNPTNVGAIFRSAAALGMGAVLLTPDCSDPLYRRAIRVADRRGRGLAEAVESTWLFHGRDGALPGFPRAERPGDRRAGAPRHRPRHRGGRSRGQHHSRL